jgi:F420-0:gamma-glutamyl ligase-like protein
VVTVEAVKNVSVMIVDTDKTYSRHGIHITPRPYVMQGIQSLGILAFIIGRSLRWTAQATPLALSGQKLSVNEALTLADAADKSRGYGAGRTTWDMARRFHVGLADITWDMLDRVDHYPIVIVKKTACD